MNSKQSDGMSKLHLGLFALSIAKEINTIRNHYKNGSKKLIYLSDLISQFELLCELYFVHLTEKVEPLIYFIEGIKSLLKLKEYVGLITKERMGCYISKDRYEEHKNEEERKKSMVMLPRSKKCLPKPDNFSMSKKMVKYALKSVNSVDSLQSLDDVQIVSGADRFKHVSIKSLNDEEHKKKEGYIAAFFSYLFRKIRYFKKLINSRKFKVSEILLILRPFLYMYFLLKNGTESYKPFLISLGIEIFGIFMGIQKMGKCKTETEKTELSGRWRGLFKYLLKEPFFSQYTVRIIHKILSKIVNDRKIGYVLSILTYFKYYHYIV